MSSPVKHCLKCGDRIRFSPAEEHYFSIENRVSAFWCPSRTDGWEWHRPLVNSHARRLAVRDLKTVMRELA